MNSLKDYEDTEINGKQTPDLFDPSLLSQYDKNQYKNEFKLRTIDPDLDMATIVSSNSDNKYLDSQGNLFPMRKVRP